MHVVEPDLDRIVADGIDGEDRDVALAADGLALRFGMTLHFGRGAGHAQQFGGEAELAAIVKADLQRAAVLGEPDFNRPRRGGIRRAQRTDQLGPIRLSPGSPTRAPEVVKATELGFWMMLSTQDTPTAAIAANTRAARKTFMTLFPTID